MISHGNNNNLESIASSPLDNFSSPSSSSSSSSSISPSSSLASLFSTIPSNLSPHLPFLRARWPSSLHPRGKLHTNRRLPTHPNPWLHNRSALTRGTRCWIHRCLHKSLSSRCLCISPLSPHHPTSGACRKPTDRAAGRRRCRKHQSVSLETVAGQ